MLRYGLLILVICFSSVAQAQTNLVPNGDFEENTGCPGSFSYLKYWIECGTANYFHECSGNLLHVPNNFAGYQYAQNGNAYAGIIQYMPFSNNEREYIMVNTTDTLIKDCIYYFKFYFSFAEKSSHYSPNISIRFFSSIVGCTTTQSILLNPQGQEINFNSDTITYNTDIWYLFEGVFKSNGTEKYLIIGNFKDDACTDTIPTGLFYGRAYIYIDNVQLYNLCEDTDVIDWDKVKPQLPSGITVNSDGKNDRLKVMNASFFNSFKLNLYDRWGHLLYSTNDANFLWDGTFQGAKVPIGVYQWQAEYTTINNPNTQYSTGNVTVLY